MPSITVATTQRRTILELLNAALSEMGMPTIASVLNTDDGTKQLVALANKVGRQLGLLPWWPDLVELFTITTDGSSTAYALPSDWGVPLAGTAWNRSSRWPLIGPTPPMQWQVYQSTQLPGGPRTRFRFTSLQMELYPLPAVDITIVHEYVSTGWILTGSGATYSTRAPFVQTDSDYVLFDESLFIAALKTEWLDAKGLDITRAQATFEQMLELGWAAAKGAPILSYAPIQQSELIGWHNIPDRNYGGA